MIQHRNSRYAHQDISCEINQGKIPDGPKNYQAVTRKIGKFKHLLPISSKKTISANGADKRHNIADHDEDVVNHRGRIFTKQQNVAQIER